jgi:hypothetical protein
MGKPEVRKAAILALFGWYLGRCAALEGGSAMNQNSFQTRTNLLSNRAPS